MGICDTVKQHAGAQFLDVIQWLDDTRNTLVYRFPIFNQAIQSGAKLVVREGQAAVFVAEGKFSECFGPGSYDLSTNTKSILSFFESIKYALNYPYKGDIYFVSTRKFTDQKWGTPQPLAVRDPDFGSIQIRAFGTFCYKISDPPTFLREVVGTDGLFTTDEINGQLKRKVLSVFASLLKDAKIPFDMLVGAGLELSDAVKENLTPRFLEDYGISVTDFTVDGVTLPPEVQKYYEKRQGMAMLGNLDAYAKLQAADAIPDAAKNPGIGGAGMGLGVGLAMGQQVVGTMMQSQGVSTFAPHTGLPSAPPPMPPPPPMATMFHYAGPSGQAQLGARDIAQKVAENRQAAHNVWAAGWPGWKAWTDVPEIVALVPPLPPPPPAPAVVNFHYASPQGTTEELPSNEIANRVRSQPGAAHLVWKAGFDGWKPAKDVPEIQAFLNAAVPPPPPGFPPPPPIG